MNSVVSSNPYVIYNKAVFDAVSNLYSDEERAYIRERIMAAGIDIESCKDANEKAAFKMMVGDFVYKAPEPVACGGFLCSVENILEGLKDLTVKKSLLNGHDSRKGAKEPFPSALRENPVSPWKVEMAMASSLLALSGLLGVRGNSQN